MGDERNEKRKQSVPGEERKSRRKKSMEEKNEKRAKRLQMLIWEKRFVNAAFVAGIIAALIFLVSFSSEYWVWVSFPHVQERFNDTGRAPYYKLGHYHGLWKICRQEYYNASVGSQYSAEGISSLYCRSMYFTLPDWINKDHVEEKKILDFRRSTVAVGFIGLILSIVANVFVFFSLNQLRYMFKRLSGCLVFITGASCWVTTEVFKQSVEFERKHMHKNIMSGSEVNLGWSYNLVWIALILYLFDGVVMLVCSRKRKGVKARSVREAQENEPVYLGRL